MNKELLIASLLEEPSVPYWGVLIVVAAALCIGLGAILVGWIFRPKTISKMKLEAYECGIEPVDDARGPIPVRYVTTAMLFLLLDAEAIFLWPWAVAFKREGLFFTVEALLFIVIVGFGYAYVWKRGAFEWTKP